MNIFCDIPLQTAYYSSLHHPKIHMLSIKLIILFAWCIAHSAYASNRLLDDTGQALQLQQAPQRIISLSPHITELLFAAGAGQKIVGATEYSDYPEPARRIPRIGGVLLDLEAIAALRPDVIVAWADGNPPAQLQRLKQLGVPIYLSSQKRLDDIPHTLERLGQLAATNATAQAAATQFRQDLAHLRKTYAERSKVRVFYQVWDAPLLTINGTHIISDALATCGGVNIFAKLPALTPNVSLENILQANPDAIITSSQDRQEPARLAAWRRWQQLSAVRNHHLFFVNADEIDRPTPRMLIGLAQLCGLLDQVRAKP